jgi:uncharacterized protein (TIGR01777 family)
MKLLVTGATGLIGKKILSLAQQKNFTVHYLTTQKKFLSNSETLRGYYWNPEKGEIDSSCFQGVDTLIHLAGASISRVWTPKNKKTILNSRINTSRLLKKEMQRQNIKMKNIICAAAIGIYPNSLEETYHEESDTEANNFLQKVAVAWEEESRSMEQFTKHLAIVRIGLVLAKEGGLLSKLTLPVRFFSGTAFASGKQWQSWIHISDLSRLFFTIAQKNWEGVFNAVAPNPVSQRTLIRQIGKVLKRPVFLPNIPAFVVKKIMGERAVLLLGSQKVSADLVLSKEFVFEFPHLQEALVALLNKKNDILTT